MKASFKRQWMTALSSLFKVAATGCALAAPVLLANSASAALENFDEMGYAVASGDFNCDGYADFAVGLPGQTVNGQQRMGRVRIYHGISGGVAYVTQFDQGIPEVPGEPNMYNEFGTSLAAGNFDGNYRQYTATVNGTERTYYRSCDDLAIGVPGETLEDFGYSPIGLRGAVAVLYSTGANGLSANNSEYITLDALGSARFPDQIGADFGRALAAFDLNKAGREPYDANNPVPRAELIVGAPGYTLTAAGPGQTPSGSGGAYTFINAGLVAVIWSQPGGNLEPGYQPPAGAARIIAAGCAVQNTATGTCVSTVGGGPQQDSERFGSAITAALVPSSPTTQRVRHLFVGAPGRAGKGSIFSFPNVNSTVPGSGSEYTPSSVSAGDDYGCSLATGRLDSLETANDNAELAVGACLQDVNGAVDAGAVYVYEDLNLAQETRITQSSISGSLESPESNDRFGFSLAFGDFDGQNFQDLCIGAPGEVISGSFDQGAILTYYSSSASPWLNTPPQVLHEGLSSIVGTLGDGDQFGFSLASGNFHVDSSVSSGVPFVSSVVVGVPFQNSTTLTDVGKVQVIFGKSPLTGDSTKKGLNAGKTDVERWDQ